MSTTPPATARDRMRAAADHLKAQIDAVAADPHNGHKAREMRGAFGTLGAAVAFVQRAEAGKAAADAIRLAQEQRAVELQAEEAASLKAEADRLADAAADARRRADLAASAA